jgi:hypothetical protein
MKNKFLAASAALSLAGVAIFGVTMSANADDAVPTDQPVVEETIAAPVELVIVETPTVVEEEAPVVNAVEEAVAATTTFSLAENTEEKLSICHSGAGNNWTYIAPDANGYNGHQNHDHDIYGLSEADCLAKNVIVEPTDEDYVTVGWLAVAAPPNHFDEDQLYLFSEETEDPSLSTLDDEIAAYLQTLECGTDADIQVDVYTKDDVTAALIAGGVLHGPNNPTEHLIPGGEGTAWKFVHLEAEDCPPPVTNSCEAGPGTHSTNLNDLWSNVDTRSKGHLEYVEGGLHIWTEDNSSQAKVSEGMAANFALKNTGVLDLNWTGSAPPPGINLFVNFGADGNGTLVYESVYGQDLWLTNGSSAAVKANAPVNGGGNGSQWHGTINQWLEKYPDAQVVGIAYALGSGVLGDGVINSITVNCNTHTFDFENEELPESHSDYTEWVDEELTCENLESGEVDQTRTRVDYTYTNAPDGSVVEHVSDPVTENGTRDLTADEEKALHEECDEELPTPDALAYTGENSQLFLNVGLSAAAIIILGVVVYFVSRTKRQQRQ